VPSDANAGNDKSDIETLELTIDYEGFIARQELGYILESIDRIIEDALLRDQAPQEGPSGRPSTSHIAISGVRSGSVTVLVVLGTAVSTYLAGRFSKGAKRGQFGDEVEKMGKLVSDGLGKLIAPINAWAEAYVRKARDEGSNLRQVKAQLPQTDRRKKRNE